QLLVEWNDTRVDYPQDRCIHRLFAEQVERTPDAVAVVFEEKQLTYRELNHRANQLARYLQSLGVEPEVLVGICVDRSWEMVVGLLGILKAGGAYVPLDPEYPQERLALMLSDSGISVLLTQEHLLRQVAGYQGLIVCFDRDRENITTQTPEQLDLSIDPDNLAYVIYTSGSTGKPKGVQITHRSVVNFLQFMSQQLELTEQDLFLSVTTLSFDIAVLEIFLPMMVGARVEIVSRAVSSDGAALIAKLASSQTTLMQATPATWQLLLTADWQGSKHLNILCGGEALPRNLAHQLRSRCAALWNLYGPTETTIWSAIYPVGTDDRTVLIGRPIANTQVYILDTHLQPVPIGVPGELHIGGTGLARGYLNRPELTTEKFIPHPFSTEPNSRLYKTGDLACYLSDGNIEYLGRIDRQVKIRGFRIELGEIEALLSQHNQIQSTVVIAREDTPDNKLLVAYVVPQPEQTVTTSELRQFLRTQLPEYMVPGAFVILESLPLTPNGKVDRRALPEPTHRSNSDRFIPPRNTLELELTHLWSKILKVDPVGVTDNFFDLGGHSLLAPQLMAQIKQQFGKDISLAILFQSPTIEQLATRIQTDAGVSGWSPLVAIQPNGASPPFFCLPGAGGNPFYLYNLARCLSPEQPFYSFQSPVQDGVSAPCTQVEVIAAEYIKALQSVQPQGPYFLGGYSLGGKVVFEMAQQLLRQGQSLALVAIFDTTAPIARPQPTDDEWDDARWLTTIAKILTTVFAKDVDLDADRLPSLAPAEQLKYVLDYLKMIDILPPDAGTTQLNQLLQAFKADAQVNYVPQEFVPIPITLFRASEVDPAESAKLPSEILQDSAWGWSKFSSTPVVVNFVPGNHLTMMTQPHVRKLAAYLTDYLSQAQAICKSPTDRQFS
ncbi:MAG: non-ribosomal peptide synthetase, partial [Cuspidothrix sp.]